MPTPYTVQLCDCMSSISKAFGFADLNVVYGDGANADLKKKRANPNVLVVGDAVSVPDRVPKELDAATGAAHKFTVATLKTNLILILTDETGAAIAGKKFSLVVDGNDKDKLEGSTAGDGKIEKKIAADAKAAALTLFLVEGAGIDGYLLNFDLGQLEHESEVRGAQARLMNLAFDCGGVSGTVDDATKDAVKGFQAKNGIQPTGVLDDPTKTKLRQVHEGA
jgi:Putative peptidoglycan binding domain